MGRTCTVCTHDEHHQINLSCSSVFLDGKKLARSVFVGMLKTELGLPIKHPQWVRLDDAEFHKEAHDD